MRLIYVAIVFVFVSAVIAVLAMLTLSRLSRLSRQNEGFDDGGGLTDAALALVSPDCVIGDYAFSEVLRRNPSDPGGQTCIVSGKGFGLLHDPSSCTPTPDIAGKTDPGGRPFGWTNPLTDGTLDAVGAAYRPVIDPTTGGAIRLNSGDYACVVDMTGVGKDALSAIDSALVQQAASLTSGAYYSAAVIAGFEGGEGVKSHPPGNDNQQQQQHEKKQLDDAKHRCDLKLTELRIASIAQCRDGQPCGISGGIVRRQPTSSSGVSNMCVDASTSPNAAVSLSPCGPSFSSSSGQLWTLTAAGLLLMSSSSNSHDPSCLSASSSDRVVSAPCDPTDSNQIWTVPKKSRDERHPRNGPFVNAASSSCLDSTTNSELVLRPCVSTASTQTWTFSPTGHPGDAGAAAAAVGRLSTPQGHCVRAEQDPDPWGTDPATGQPYKYRLVASSNASRACPPDRETNLFSVNANGTLESVAFPGQCVAFDAKTWQVGWGVRLAACDRSAKPSDAQAFGPSAATAPLSTKDGSAGAKACFEASGDPTAGGDVAVIGTSCPASSDGALTFQSTSKHPAPRIIPPTPGK